MESSPEIIENPFIKPANREWSVSVPKSLSAPVSPPRSRQKRRLKRPGDRDDHVEAEEQPRQNDLEDISKNSQSIDLARIEAGKASVENHLEVWSAALLSVTRPTVAGLPRLPHDSWVDLYRRNQLPQGRHFVIHQHNHPIAGPHYDLRLQISQSSSVSFAIMYGLPGNPNSGRLNRNATETRVHNLWVSSLLLRHCYLGHLDLNQWYDNLPESPHRIRVCFDGQLAHLGYRRILNSPVQEERGPCGYGSIPI
jgi:hypothetical protein